MSLLPINGRFGGKDSLHILKTVDLPASLITSQRYSKQSIIAVLSSSLLNV